MKSFLKKLLEFVQEQNGELSSRRLAFIYICLMITPTSLIFGWFHQEYFVEIINSFLIFAGSLVGLTTISRIAEKGDK